MMLHVNYIHLAAGRKGQRGPSNSFLCSVCLKEFPEAAALRFHKLQAHARIYELELSNRLDEGSIIKTLPPPRLINGFNKYQRVVDEDEEEKEYLTAKTEEEHHCASLIDVRAHGKTIDRNLATLLQSMTPFTRPLYTHLYKFAFNP